MRVSGGRRGVFFEVGPSRAMLKSLPIFSVPLRKLPIFCSSFRVLTSLRALHCETHCSRLKQKQTDTEEVPRGPLCGLRNEIGDNSMPAIKNGVPAKCEEEVCRRRREEGISRGGTQKQTDTEEAYETKCSRIRR